MATIQDVLNNINSLRLREEVPNIIQRGDDQFITLNQKQIFDHSEKSDESPIGFYSSITTSIDKQKSNPRPGFGRVDLYDTGDFFNGFFLEVKYDSYLIYSRDDKVSKLVEKYSDDIFGLTPPSKEKLINETVYPGIKSYIEAKTGLILG